MKEKIASSHRGAISNLPNRFEILAYEPDLDCPPEEQSHPKTQFLVDHSESLITYNNSPDVGFSASLNVYRGCEHGCAYCYARPTHEYLGFSAGLDFETRIMVKMNAPALLRRELNAKSWKPQVVIMSGVTDCYQPAERRFKLTRECLKIFAEFGNPTAIITKNFLVTRDLDVLKELHAMKCIAVNISVTSLDPALATVLEPRAALPKHRLRAVSELAQAGIPVNVMVAPIIPGLNDIEIPRILKAAKEAGATSAAHTIVRLPYGVKDIFSHWLKTHFPEKYERVLARIRNVRGGKLNQSAFGSRMSGEGNYAEQLRQLFEVNARRYGLPEGRESLSTENFRRVEENQLQLL